MRVRVCVCVCVCACVCGQVVFKQMGYASWVELTTLEAKQKATPFRMAIKETWARLKRAKPEMQTAAKPFVKEKWDERAYFLVQVRDTLPSSGCACA